jgi:hypothetical protein
MRIGMGATARPAVQVTIAAEDVPTFSPGTILIGYPDRTHNILTAIVSAGPEM